MTWRINRFTVVALSGQIGEACHKTEATKLKRGDIRLRTGADLMAILWRDKRDIRMLTNIHNAPAESNFCNEAGKAVKSQIVMDYNHHMGCVDKGDRMANLLHQPAHIQVDEKIVLSSVRPGRSQ